VNERLKTALSVESVPVPVEPVVMAEITANDGIVTTEEELEAFYIIRAILREVVPVKRVVMRDVQSYCGILLDDNNRKPICRLYFNATNKAIGFFDTDRETRVSLPHMDDLYKHADRLKSTVVRHDAAKNGAAKNGAAKLVVA
jgi:hypothetical protein